MSDYTTTEIEVAIEGGDFSWSELADDYAPETIKLRGEDVPIKRIAGKAPCEGGGEDVNVVFKVGDQLFEKTGYYASHYGSDWDGDLTEVRPEEKIITVYVEV